MALTRVSKKSDSKPRPRKMKSSENLPEVLYVEDEDLNWEVMFHMLEGDFRLTRAKNSVEAFEMLENKSFEVVLMDIQLAGSDLSGIEITKLMKGKFNGPIPTYATPEKNYEAPVIFVTAYAVAYDKKDLIGFGGTDLFFKPVEFPELTQAIKQLIAN